MPIYMLFSPIITPPTSELTKDGNIAIVQLCYLARCPIPVYVNFVCHCLWSVKLNPDTHLLLPACTFDPPRRVQPWLPPSPPNTCFQFPTTDGNTLGSPHVRALYMSHENNAGDPRVLKTSHWRTLSTTVTMV